MKINIRHLINYDDVISYKIPEDNNEYIASIIGEPDLESESTLFFATNTIDYKWYTSKTDRSVLVRRLSKYKKNWIFVIGDKELLSNNSNYYILVRSVNIFVEKITKKIIGTINKRIIAITGSVGKSTLSKLLSLWIDKAQLIDVKRLTPLNLADFIFNRLKTETEYIIAEVGLYYPGQINQLADILSPYIGIITNIYDMHIGWNGIKTKEALLSEKLNLLNKSKIRIISKEIFDKYEVSHLLNEKDIVYNNFEYTNIVNSCNLLPKTRVSKNLLELIELAINNCNYTNDFCIEKISKIIKENDNTLSLHKYMIDGTLLFVDSHSSIAGYFQAMSSHWYKSAMLVILSLNFPKEENIRTNIELIKETFSNYTKICISNRLIRYFGKNNKRIQYINEKNLISEIQNEKVVFLHDPKTIRLSGKNKKKWEELTSEALGFK